MLPDWILKLREIEAKKDQLSGSDLSNAKLMRGNLSGANFENADLSGAYLIQANLSGAELSNADLTRAVLSEANLSSANLEDADLSDTFLHGANLQDVFNLTCDQLESAKLDRETILPSYIQINWITEELFDCKEV